ncbi:MAG: glycosyltransferase family 2 protein, partial [Nitrososphaerota archaeon]|nr:glycosyltransferase family 2 protein [Nitrososphaerota archaeon]
MNQLKVDVVLLTKNSLKPCLRECVDSIYSNVPVSSLIVVDGGSTDGTLELLQTYPNVKIVSDVMGNRATARQKGIEAVETLWHVHVDSDVILCPDWFMRVWRRVEVDVGAVWGAALPIDR